MKSFSPQAEPNPTIPPSREFFSAARAKGQRIVSSAIEHSSVRGVIRHLTETESADPVVVPVEPNGIVKVETWKTHCTDTVLVTLMAVNNERRHPPTD